MSDKVIVYASEIDRTCLRHDAIDRAKLAVMTAAKELDVKCDCRLSTSWLVWINKGDRDAFIQLAREKL